MKNALIINRKTIRKILLFIVGFNMILGMGIELFLFSPYLRYVSDVLLLVTFGYIMLSKSKYNRKLIKFERRSIGLFIIITVFSVVLGVVSPILFLWAARNIYRFLFIYISCVYAWEESDVQKLFGMFYWMQIINFVLSLIQFFALGIRQDNLGGIFGVEVGVNGYTNLFFCLLTAYHLNAFYARKVSVSRLAFIMVSTLIIASMAELKIYYIELVVIILMVVLLNRPNFKTVGIVIFSVCSLIIGLHLMKEYFPEQYKYIVDWNSMYKYATMKSGGYNISRFNAYSEINKLFFGGDILKNLLGFGFGNCEYAQFDFLVSNFFKQYGYLNYRWFMHEMLFLETGYLGTVSYLLIFVAIAFNAAKCGKTLDIEKKYYVKFVLTMIPLVVVNFIYNQSLRSEAAYMMFPALAAVPILSKEMQKFGLLNIITFE